MFRTIIICIILTSILNAQDYHWPIRAQKSLSATFCEYRSGHLHAGIDIKTWGEMEVPCLAVAEGYIERILIGYKGYGRGLFLRLNDGNMAVYGHLELFTPALEKLIQEKQLELDRYSLRLEFTSDQFPVEAGQLIGYSGTSGTEHPHLHFEVRDTINQVVNPLLFYSGIKDNQAPIIDEVMLTPLLPESRINNSKLPVIFGLQHTGTLVHATGPFLVSVNAHDRANGTYNKYNIYQIEALVNDHLVYSRVFDQVPLKLTGFIDHLYPGERGKRGWRFMSMFTRNDSCLFPFTPPNQHGTITPEGLSSLTIRVADIHGNQTTKSLNFRRQRLASWKIDQVEDQTIVTRSYTGNGYERVQFYTSDNTFIPVAQTLYRLNSTTWIMNQVTEHRGIRALGSSESEIKWISPPPDQPAPELNYEWGHNAAGYFLKLESTEPYIFPLAYQLKGNAIKQGGELTQTTDHTAESDIISLDSRARSERVDIMLNANVIASLELQPAVSLNPHDTCEFKLDFAGFKLKAANQGTATFYLQVDTLRALFDGQPIIGAYLKIINTPDGQFNGRLSFIQQDSDPVYSFFSPGKKGSWKRQESHDVKGVTFLDLDQGGSFFLLNDDVPPVVKPLKQYRNVKRGDRLVFKISDNSRVIPHPRHALSATIDGQRFFPDYNPLRRELSFHVPQKSRFDRYIFELTVQDQSSNITKFTQAFTVTR